VLQVVIGQSPAAAVLGPLLANLFPRGPILSSFPTRAKTQALGRPVQVSLWDYHLPPKK
jgi:hypothetical protein